MTKLTCAIMVESLDQALAASVRAAEFGAELIEFRIDSFTEDLPALTRLVEQSALPCIVTCRPTWEGGEYQGDNQTRCAVFAHACAGAVRPAYLDVELAAYQRDTSFADSINRLVDYPGQAQPTNTGLILSAHDFKMRPADLLQCIEAMAAAPACRVMKLAWQARSLRDNLEAFEIISHRHKPTIALCMGELGLSSRVLAKKFGALLTYAALGGGPGTAIGQPVIDDLKTLYRWDHLQPDTEVFGVIGWPVGHSMSPAIHNAGFDTLKYNGVYLPMPIPDDYVHFKATVGAWLEMPELQFKGASVTIPHKQNLLKFVSEHGGQIEALAERIGAANTLTVRPDGSLFASNTDYAAALDSVCAALNIERQELSGKRVAVIGAGGAARAVVAGFAHYGATVVVYNRTKEKAEALAQQFDAGASGVSAAGSGKVVAARLEKLCDSCCEVFINCTPIGMHPNIQDTPIPSAAKTKSWGPDTVVFDTIYNPIQTRLLREAAEAGCKTISGVEMFVRQAADQFKGWTQLEAPLDVFRRVITRELGALS